MVWPRLEQHPRGSTAAKTSTFYHGQPNPRRALSILYLFGDKGSIYRPLVQLCCEDLLPVKGHTFQHQACGPCVSVAGQKPAPAPARGPAAKGETNMQSVSINLQQLPRCHQPCAKPGRQCDFDLWGWFVRTCFFGNRYHVPETVIQLTLTEYLHLVRGVGYFLVYISPQTEEGSYKFPILSQARKVDEECDGRRQTPTSRATSRCRNATASKRKVQVIPKGGVGLIHDEFRIGCASFSILCVQHVLSSSRLMMPVFFASLNARISTIGYHR